MKQCLVRTEKNLATRVLRELLAAVVKQEDAPASSMTHMDKAIAILVRATDWRPDDPDMKKVIEDATEHLKFYPWACGE